MKAVAILIALLVGGAAAVAVQRPELLVMAREVTGVSEPQARARIEGRWQLEFTVSQADVETEGFTDVVGITSTCFEHACDVLMVSEGSPADEALLWILKPDEGRYEAFALEYTDACGEIADGYNVSVTADMEPASWSGDAKARTATQLTGTWTESAIPTEAGGAAGCTPSTITWTMRGSPSP